MKKLLFILIIFIVSNQVFGQGIHTIKVSGGGSGGSTSQWRDTTGGIYYLLGSASIGTTLANTSAQLDVQGTTKGVLLPRLTNAQMLAIATPANGLMVTNTDSSNRTYEFDGTNWRGLAFRYESSGTSLSGTGYAKFSGSTPSYISLIPNTDLANSAVGLLSGTNTGDNATNTQYSVLVSNATHTGDATGATALTVVRINGTSLSGLATGLLKNTTGTGVPSIAINSDLPAMSATIGGAVPTPPNNAALFLNGAGAFAVPFATAAADATDASFTIAVNTIKYLPASTLTVSRAITIPTGTNGNYIEIFNNETNFIWTLIGVPIYQNDGITVITSLLANKNYLFRFISSKWRVLNN